MSNNLDPDQDRQAQQFVGPDLGPNCLPRLSTDDTSRQRVKRKIIFDPSTVCYPKQLQKLSCEMENYV